VTSHATSVHPLGFRRLDPLPDPAALHDFYGEEYYEGLDGSARRGPDLSRLRADDHTASTEREWLEATLFEDIRHHLRELGHNSGRLLDAGCGTGDFLDSMRAAGWEVEGTELSNAATAQCRNRGLSVSSTDLQSQAGELESTFDVITMINFLEHVLDPVGDLGAVHRMLRPDGCVVVQVPNDFSLLQRVASEALGLEPWWIAVPDHLNYFDYESLEKTLDHVGFRQPVRSGSFPMELFLLLGSDYISDPASGAEAHAVRKNLELNIKPDSRRTLADAFAKGGLGRNCLVIARRQG